MDWFDGKRVNKAINDIFAKFYRNAVGSGERQTKYWEETLRPSTIRKFSVPAFLLRNDVIPSAAFFQALQYHTNFNFYVNL